MIDWLRRWLNRPGPNLRGHQGTMISLVDPTKQAELRRCRCGVRYYSTRHTCCTDCRQKRPRPAKVLSYPGPRRLPR